MKSLLGLVQSAPVRIDIEFKDPDGKPHKPTTTVKAKKEDTEEVPVYSNGNTVSGEIRVTPMTTKKIEHQGIKVQLVGQIELANERGTAHEFVSFVRELAPPGDLTNTKLFPFEFRNVELQYDSYRGTQVRCRYVVRVAVTGKGMTPDAKRDFNIWVINYEKPSEAAAPIKMEVGIEDCLHIEFEYDKARYHLKDVVVGRIYFLLVRIKLKHMEIEIRRKETTGAGSAAHSESETLAKYEIMDGAPVRGESVPIRLYLSPYELTPSYHDVHNKFSVRYFLNLVLVDEEDRRYFKQQPITLYRKAADTPEEAAAHAAAAPPKLAAPPAAAMLPPPSTGTQSQSGTAPYTQNTTTPAAPAPAPTFAQPGSTQQATADSAAPANNSSVPSQPSYGAAAAAAPTSTAVSNANNGASQAPAAPAPAAAPAAAAAQQQLPLPLGPTSPAPAEKAPPEQQQQQQQQPPLQPSNGSAADSSSASPLGDVAAAAPQAPQAAAPSPPPLVPSEVAAAQQAGDAGSTVSAADGSAAAAAASAEPPLEPLTFGDEDDAQ